MEHYPEIKQMGDIRAIAKVRYPLQTNGVEPELDACVDTGAVMLLVGRDIVERLELPIMGRAIVTLADDSRQEMDKAGPSILSWVTVPITSVVWSDRLVVNR